MAESDSALDGSVAAIKPADPSIAAAMLAALISLTMGIRSFRTPGDDRRPETVPRARLGIHRLLHSASWPVSPPRRWERTS